MKSAWSGTCKRNGATQAIKGWLGRIEGRLERKRGDGFYPKGVPVNIELPHICLYDLLARTAREYPEQLAVIDGEKNVTYAELQRIVDRFAAVLYRLGLRKGDRIAVMLPNCLEYIVSYYAIQRLGGILVQVNPMYQQSELAYLLEDSEATAFICLRRFDANHTLEVIRKYRPTFFPGVPTMYIALLQHPDAETIGLDSFKVCNSGSAPMPVEVMREFEWKTGARIIEGYGLSEAAPITHRNPIHGKRKPGSIGLPLPNTDCKVVDLETGTVELPPGEPGELIIKGPQVMKGYWKNQEETAAVLRDGWLYTGDIDTMDEEGYFYIVGRKKEMIIASGYNIFPIEVEEVIYQHPAVAEACVFGIPDPYRGETVMAVIVPKNEMPVTEKEIIDWCSARLAKYKVPRSVEFRDRMPKTAVGKILRRSWVEEVVAKQKSVGRTE